MPRFKSINFYQNKPKIKLFLPKKIFFFDRLELRTRTLNGIRPALPNWNATDDKNVIKKTIVSSVSSSIFAYNSTRVQQKLTIILIQGIWASQFNFCQPI